MAPRAPDEKHCGSDVDTNFFGVFLASEPLPSAEVDGFGLVELISTFSVHQLTRNNAQQQSRTGKQKRVEGATKNENFSVAGANFRSIHGEIISIIEQ